MLYLCRNSSYSKHMAVYTSEWTRDETLKNINNNNKLVEAAGIEPAFYPIPKGFFGNVDQNADLEPVHLDRISPLLFVLHPQIPSA